MESKHSPVDKLVYLCNISKTKFFIKELYKHCGLWARSKDLENDTEQICMLILTYFDSFAFTYPI